MRGINSVLLLAALMVVAFNPSSARAYEAFRSIANAHPVDEEETRIWGEAGTLRDELVRTRWIKHDTEVVKYMQRIVDNLYPEFVPLLRVHLVRIPVVNAFATPSGDIFVHQSLLARMDNEAQLATVLAHEGAHVVYRHGVRARTTQSFMVGANAIAQTVLAVAPMPIVATPADLIRETMSRLMTRYGLTIFAISSMYGYTRSMEREADSVGFERLKHAGYDVRQASKIFAILGRELEASEISEPYFFASHPRVKERQESFDELAAGTTGGVIGEVSFVATVSNLRMDDIGEELRSGRYAQLIAFLARQRDLPDQHVNVRYYLGESYRLRNAEGDPIRAESEYRQVLSLAPAHFGASRGLGVICLRQGRLAEAKAHFMMAASAAPNPDERGFVEQYLAAVSRKEKS